MSEKLHEFRTDAITVTWSGRRCIHAAVCVAGLPRVFRPGERPWIHAGESGADAVAGVVARCPTGALHFERHDGGAPEPVPDRNTVLVSRNGPTYLRGNLEVRTTEGEVLLRETRLALCRCGASRQKPFCDNSHREAGFRDPGELRDAEAVQDPGGAPAAGVLVVTLHEDGPVELTGPFAIASSDGGTIREGTSTWLCRCGQSQDKPFCDSSHERVGFKSG